MDVCLGLRRTFSWRFVLADISTPFLGADFLCHYGLLVELQNKASKVVRNSSTCANNTLSIVLEDVTDHRIHVLPRKYRNFTTENPTMEDLDNKPPESYKLIEVPTTTKRHKQAPARDKWGKGIEFLLSCISLSVGLGNVWRFPFVALENGGGAFLIPYVVVLVLVGGPVYYLEVLIGQFCSRGCVQAYEFSPIMRGVGYGQAFATILGISYYASILGLTIRYLLLSFTTELPWAFCEKEWGSTCINSSGVHQHPNISGISTRSSAELFYFNNVLYEVDSIEDGVGLPDKYLVGCLGLAWIGIGGALIKGIKSSGKALYFLAVFPYFVLITLLVRAVSLEGALDGVLYFLTPQWNEILNVKVWYAAISQAFFSMAICFGTLMMFGSYNEFTRNVQRG